MAADYGRELGVAVRKERVDWDQFAARFGVSIARAMHDPRDITHNLRTVIIDADGKLVKVYTGNDWSPEQVFSRSEILAVLSQRYGAITPITEGRDPSAPAERFRLADGATFGIVASTTAPFCRSCDRSRITADGTWFMCLYAGRGIDLREPLRKGASDAELVDLITNGWRDRTDRGAEERLGLAARSALYPLAALRADPHREMHTRGG